MKIKFKRLSHTAKVPTKATTGSGAYDLYSVVQTILFPGEREAVDTGIAMEIPEGFVGLICPRSGLAAKQGATVLNGPGVIDSDFRDSVKAIVINQNVKVPWAIEIGDKIAQILFVKAEEVDFEETSELSSTVRGTGGLGSTGK
jgi:dUTP pyrophosphatase